MRRPWTNDSTSCELTRHTAWIESHFSHGVVENAQTILGEEHTGLMNFFERRIWIKGI